MERTIIEIDLTEFETKGQAWRDIYYIVWTIYNSNEKVRITIEPVMEVKLDQ